MAVFTLVGTTEPFLHVTLKRDEKIYCESNAMVMMEDTLELKGKLQGGLMSSLVRRFTSDESLFQQHIQAVRGDGDCLLSPNLDGDLQVLDVGVNQYCLADGAFVAAVDTVDIKVQMQSIGSALFANNGGFFLMRTSGQGQVVVSGAGSLFELDVTPDKDVVVDNGHVVCWDANLQHEVSLSTNRSNGIIGTMVNSLTSGKGVVIRFKGTGKIVVCSRNRSNLLTWIRSKLP